MPSIEETKRQVQASLRSQQQQPHEVDHDAILADLWDEIDSHNDQSGEPHVPARHRARHGESRQGRVDYDPSSEKKTTSRFRFKDGQEPRKRRKVHPLEDRDHRGRRKHRRDRSPDRTEAEEAAHPFPREPTNPDRDSHESSTAAFQESLFDALADDEGAAYWESVYSQPIHVFPRPTVQNAIGGLEEMNDEQYAAYVQTKMWEKKNPHIVLERERKEKQRREEEEEKTRQREEFVRRKQKAAWERAQNEGARKFAGAGNADDDYEYIFDFEDDSKRPVASQYSTPEQKEYCEAWKQYLAAWDQLKLELAEEPEAGSSTPKEVSPSKRIPWPVLQSQPVVKPNIEQFMRHMPLEQDGPSREQMLKVERVRWHPDKVQQRFREVDEGTMKIVTGVFQVVDALLEAERKPRR